MSTKPKFKVGQRVIVREDPDNPQECPEFAAVVTAVWDTPYVGTYGVKAVGYPDAEILTFEEEWLEPASWRLR